jgi:hypothetical protein
MIYDLSSKIEDHLNDVVITYREWNIGDDISEGIVVDS